MRNLWIGPLGLCVIAVISAAACTATGTPSSAASAAAYASPFVARSTETPQVAIWTYADFPWGQVTNAQRADVTRIRDKVAARYRKFLRIGLLGPKHVLAVFVSNSDIPPDYGAESLTLNDCRSIPNCKYFCGGRYSDGGVAPIGPSGSCEDGALFFYDDINVPFPRGQHHGRTRNPCVYINGKAFGSCAKM